MRTFAGLLSLWLSCAVALPAPAPQRSGIYVPFYDATANNHTSAARGWNSFGLQANPAAAPTFVFDDLHFAQQCDQLVTRRGGEYYCSLDSGWSGNGGDPFARIVPEPGVFTTFSPVLKGLADHLHERGLKLGVYLLPGAFEGDQDLTIEGTNVRLGDVLDFNEPGYNLRRAFKWGEPGVQEWHDSVIRNLASLGVDMIKLDFLTPGSPDAGEELPKDTSLSAVNYHNSIQRLAPWIRLDLSWKLVREEPVWSRWRASADALRLDQDINNAQAARLVSFEIVQRAIENYRLFINEQTQNATRRGHGIRIRPDMDNMFVGNAAPLGGLSNVERYTVAIHWIGAGANLITGSDMTALDALGRELLFNDEALDVADFTAQFPMQPRNPGTGRVAARQLQAWVAGPDSAGTAIVVLANYGPDQGQGGFRDSLTGIQLVDVTLETLGLGRRSWSVRRVWGGARAGTMARGRYLLLGIALVALSFAWWALQMFSSLFSSAGWSPQIRTSRNARWTFVKRPDYLFVFS
ncbi:glycoside hydrolase [Auricularia subglabra TFB-10046 SS5]|uniref:alpha-galactosidase n=1 Tax=Auricularia subglabra (strain TFB-10046 / SS5) TaxID=717982 RepID=J0LHM2_AURST|nr:glycoside hydrolase [Auricularia subglabra TFB-10046 SS5]